uniref:Chromosome 3 open reading frame 33 n=1 Tax=Nothoprocta perdicaria TaxID=30464 RepID=A0A8C7E8H7_NOTPE
MDQQRHFSFTTKTYLIINKQEQRYFKCQIAQKWYVYRSPSQCGNGNAEGDRGKAAPARPTTKFTSALDIPVEFVEKNVKLRGKIRHVTETGLEVEHVPITLSVSSGQSNSLLLVRLAGVELTPGAVVWLQEELKPSQMIWFQLLGRQDLALECLVLVNKGRFLSTCLNEEILRQGLGRTARIEGLRHDSRLYWKLHKRLLRAELKAAKKNKGIWKEESAAGKMRDRVSNSKLVQAERLRPGADGLAVQGSHLQGKRKAKCHSSLAKVVLHPRFFSFPYIGLWIPQVRLFSQQLHH